MRTTDTADLHSKRHKAKILFLFVVPLLFFVIASSVHIIRLSGYAQQLTVLDCLTNQATDLSALLHESQKERGMTGIFLSSGGVSFSALLASQRQSTSRLVNSIIESMPLYSHNYQNEAFANALTSFTVELNKLPAIRQQVSELDINASQAIQYYTTLNNKLLNIISIMAQESVEPELARTFLAYVNFLKEKERVGIERAVLGTAFTQDAFLADSYQYFVQLETEQNLYRIEFLTLASPQIKKNFSVLVNGPAYKKVQFYRDIAHRKSVSGAFGVDSGLWFDVITAKVDLLKGLENQIAQELIAKSLTLKKYSEIEKWLWIITTLLITALTIMSANILIRNINSSFARRLKEYRILFENSSSGMVVINPDDRTFLFCNSQFSAMTGYSQQQILTLKTSDIYPLAKSDKSAQLFGRLISGEITFIDKLALVRRDNTVFFAEISTFPILIKNHNYIVANIKDIGAKLNAQSNLKKSQQALQMVLDSLNSAVSVVDTHSKKPIYLNKKANEIYKEKAQAEPVWSLLSPQGCDLESSLSENSTMEFTEQVFNKSRKRWYQVTHKLIEWYDNRIVHLRMLEDITDRYDAEHKNQNLLIEIRKLSLRNYSLQEKERKQLAAELHDQLGQLMTGLMLQADYIHRCVKGENRSVESSAQSIIETTQELITSVQGITNKLRPVLLDQLGLVEALSELVQQWQHINKDILFKFSAESCPDELPDQVAISIYRIVQESLTNVSKHAGASTVIVSLKFEEMTPDADGASLVLHISDDGIGFNKDEMHFNGMGLINMRERVEALGGVFRLLSQSGKGVDTLAFIPVKLKESEAL